MQRLHDPESEVATQKLFDQFHDFVIPPNSNPVTALHNLESLNTLMGEKGMESLPDTFLHARFVRALPEEYSNTKETLQSMKNRTRDEIVRMVGAPTCPRKRGHIGHPEPRTRRFYRARAETEAARGEAVGATAAVRAVAAAEETAAIVGLMAAAAEVKTTAAVEAVAAPAVAAVAVEALNARRAAVSAATGRVTSEGTAPRRRATSSSGAPGARVSATPRTSAYRIRRCS